MLKALLLKPDDSVAVIHWKINQPLVRLGAVEGGAQYRVNGDLQVEVNGDLQVEVRSTGKKQSV